MKIALPAMPPLADVTRTIALIPELTRSTAQVVRMNHAFLLSQVGGSSDRMNAIMAEMESDDDECDDPSHDHAMENVPLKPWEAGRKVLELLMLVRSHEELGQDFHTVFAQAAPEIDSPQHALDVVMAAVHMVAALADEDDIATFSDAILRAEATFP